jgi:hypothetical protein
MTLSAPIGVDDDRGTTNRILAIGALMIVHGRRCRAGRRRGRWRGGGTDADESGWVKETSEERWGGEWVVVEVGDGCDFAGTEQGGGAGGVRE